MKKRNIKNNLLIATVASATLLTACGNNKSDEKKEDIEQTKEIKALYDGRCGECRENLPDEDEYCRYCGTKRGEGSFEEFNPEDNMNECVYGSPIEYSIRCDECEIELKENAMTGEAEPEFCPQCGQEAEVSEKDPRDR